jgi:hypothetical protein
MRISPLLKQSTMALALLTLALRSTAAPVGGQFAVSKATLAQDEEALAGNWSGESLCQAKNSPCQDEKVVYHISQSREPGKVKASADKIVDGKVINMGTIDFTYDKKDGTLVNETSGRVWKFTVKGNTMQGALTLPDKTIYRRVTLKKEQ